jgi:1,4-dihydroxy-2-naphthoate polyprenyltransferase
MPEPAWAGSQKGSPLATLARVARPQFLLAGLGLYGFGACWGMLLGAPFSPARLLLGCLVLMCAQLSVSYSNDYFDVDVDRLGQRTFFSGGSRVLVEHPELREPARRVALGLIACSLAMGILFQVLYSLPPWFLCVLLLGNLLGWFYSAPPLRLAYRGLGELVMMLTIGVLMPGIGTIAPAGRVQPEAFLFTLPLALYGLAFILCVEIPDMEMDSTGHKRNWVAVRGRGFGFTVIAAGLFLSSLYFFILPQHGSQTYPVDFHFLGWCSTLPLTAGTLGLILRPAGKQPATRMINAILLALVVFCLVADGYLALLVIHKMI